MSYFSLAGIIHGKDETVNRKEQSEITKWSLISHYETDPNQSGEEGPRDLHHLKRSLKLVK